MGEPKMDESQSLWNLAVEILIDHRVPAELVTIEVLLSPCAVLAIQEGDSCVFPGEENIDDPTKRNSIDFGTNLDLSPGILAQKFVRNQGLEETPGPLFNHLAHLTS